MKRSSLLFPLVFFLSITSIISKAATVTWNGGTGDWNNSANWDSGSIPDGNDDVIIPANSVVTIPDGFDADALSITINDGELIIEESATLTIISSNANGLELNGSAKVDNYGEVSLSSITTSGIVLNQNAFFSNEPNSSLEIEDVGEFGISLNGDTDFDNEFLAIIDISEAKDCIRAAGNARIDNDGEINLADAEENCIYLEGEAVFDNESDVFTDGANLNGVSLTGMSRFDSEGKLEISATSNAGISLSSSAWFNCSNDSDIRIENVFKGSGVILTDNSRFGCSGKMFILGTSTESAFGIEANGGDLFQLGRTNHRWFSDCLHWIGRGGCK